MGEEEAGDCALVNDVQAASVMQVSEVWVGSAQAGVEDELAWQVLFTVGFMVLFAF